MDLASGVDVCVSRVRSAAGITVDPFEPVLSAVSRDQILQVIGGWNALTLSCPEEVLHDWIRIVAERNLDWALETMDVPVAARALVRLMLLHERNQLFGCPALSLEVIIIRSRRTGVHHEAIKLCERRRNLRKHFLLT